MTTFWRPLYKYNTAANSSAAAFPYRVEVYQLWCRCDVCFRENASQAFHFFVRDDSEGQICQECFVRGGVAEDLAADGWQSA